MGSHSPEVHSEILAVEGEATERDALHILLCSELYGRRIGNDAVGIVPCLLGIVELYATHLRGGLHGEKGMLAVGDNEKRARRTGPVRQGCAASCRSVGSQQRHIAPQHKAALHGIAAFDGFHIEHTAKRTHAVDGCLEVVAVRLRRVAGQDAYSLHREVALSIDFGGCEKAHEQKREEKSRAFCFHSIIILHSVVRNVAFCHKGTKKNRTFK